MKDVINSPIPKQQACPPVYFCDALPDCPLFPLHIAADVQPVVPS